MQYKLIALDLDHTLLTSTRTISERNKRAIARAVEKGATVVLATGRPFGGTAKYCEELGIKQPVITNGGAVVVDSATGETIFDQKLNEDLAREVIGFLHEQNCYHQIYDASPKFLCEAYTMYTELYAHFTGMQWKVVGDFLKLSSVMTPKVLCVDMASRLRVMLEMLRERFPGRLIAGISQPFFLEIYHPDAHKGAALRRLAENMGLDACNVIAMGDSHIDKSMIEYAGLGVAMKNSTPEVLEAADLIAPGNDEDGVAAVIEEYVLNEVE